MSNTIDTKVVEMKFNNADFERGVAATLKSLANLKQGLKLDGASKGLDEVSKSVSKFNLGNIGQNVQQIASRFSGMGIVGVTALASIAHQAIATGVQMAKSLTTDPLKTGLQEYETNLNSIQTILANTGLEGKNGLAQVTHALDELNHYADQTIYNFSEMARNIGTFTAAGIKLEPATAAIKGIANLAAISGSSAEQASSAMYQLSQAMAAGKATLVDWNSVVNAGMGGKVFQEALKETARVQGVAIDDIIKKNGSFRDSLQEGWLTTSVLTDTLAKFTGDLTEAQLKAMGYNDQQIAGIIKMGKTAQDAATKVKTVSQLINTLQEAASSGWAQTWQLVFGDFDEARTLFTNVSNVLGGFISKSSEARNKVIGDWKKLGGRKALIDGIAIAFANLMDILTPISKAFRDIFPATTGKQLADLSMRFRDFMASLRLGEDTMDNIRRTFRGVFAIFSIGISVLKGIGTAVKTFFAQFKGGSGGILEFTGNIGDWLVALDQAIKKGEGFTQFFSGLGKAIAMPIKFLQNFASVLKDVVSGIADFGSSGADKISGRFQPLAKLGPAIGKAWSKVLDILKKVFTAFEPLIDKFQDFFSNIGTAISQAFAGADYDSILDGINTGLLAGLVGLFAMFFKNGLKLDVGGGFLDSAKDALDGVTDSMKAMQTQLKANALLKIAGAIALLTVSVVALSLIDPKKLATALGGLTVMFTQLLGAMAIFQAITATGGFVRMPFLTASLILLAAAIDVLAIAVTKIAKLDWNGLAKGLVGVGALLGGLLLFTKFAAVDKGGIKTGAGLILLAFAVKLLADSVKDLANLNWEEMAKGLIGVGGILGALALFTKIAAVGKGGVLQGAGIILLAFGIKVLAGALKDLGQFSWSEIGKGLVAMAGGLGLMATALSLMPPSSILNAAAIFVVAQSLSTIGDAVAQMGNLKWSQIAKGLLTMGVALGSIALAIGLLPPSSLLSAAAVFVTAASLKLIAEALGSMGGMSWVEIAKGLITLAASLGIIAGALYLMTAALPGAAALVVATAALKLLAPVLLAFGEMSWGEILKGLAMLAGVLAVLGAAGLLLTPVIPALLGLGVAITLLGVGMLAAGAGMMLFGVGLTAVAAGGAAASAVLFAALQKLLNMLPGVADTLGRTLVALAQAIIKAAPPIAQAITVVLMSLLNAIIKLTPKITQTFGVLLDALLRLALKYVPRLVQVGLTLIQGFLKGLASNMSGLVKAATDVVVAFINAVAKNQNRVIDAGVKMVIDFINGVANTIRTQSGPLGAAGANLGLAIVEGMARGIAGGIGQVTSKAREVASAALNAAKNVLGVKSPSREFAKIGAFVVQGFVKGLDGNKSQINAAFYGLRAQLADFRREAAKDIGELTAKLDKLNKARTKDKAAIRATTHALAQARAEYTKANNTYNVLTKKYLDDTIALGKLADKYDAFTTKIKAAQQAYTDLIRTRDDYAKSISDKYGDLATAEEGQSLSDFLAQERKKISDTKVFAVLLQKLRGLGLNDEAYRDLLEKGTSAIPFAQELLASGKAGVAEVNKIGAELDKLGASLGKTAAGNLYNAGIQAALGLVKGLQSQQAKIEKQMDAIAAAMVKAIKKALGIKSPSREMMEIARHTVDGMTVGLDKYGGAVAVKAKDVGNTAVEAMRKSMSDISSVLITDDNFNPIIRPVLDLSAVKNDATRISGLLSAKPLNVSSVLDRAKDISASYRDSRLDEQARIAAPPVTQEFTQINNSPKALSPAEIYRNTKNQLSLAKEALDAK